MVSIGEKLKVLGPRPSSDAVEHAKQDLALIDARLSTQLFSGNIENSEIAKLQDAAEQEKLPFKTVLWLDQLYQSYEAMMAKTFDEDEVECKGTSALMISSDDGVLNLSGLQLTRLVNDSSKLSSLVALDLSKNNLEALPDYFDNLTKLRVLNVSGNMLKSLPESIGRCSSLLELDASFNQLEYLASNFGGNLHNLQKLFLQLNKLNALPLSTSSLTSLVHLEIQFNKLVTLPVDIGKLKNLRKLDASGNFNNLTSLPESIGYASSLVNLDLSYNQISKLPLSFGYLTQLRELRLLQNPLVVPPAQVVEHSTKAVVEYMSEQLRQSLLQDVDPRPSLLSKYVRAKPLVRPSWFGELLGGLCSSSSSLVLGGSSSAFRFVDLHDDDSD